MSPPPERNHSALGACLASWLLTTVGNQRRDPSDRPTAEVLLSQHPFCELDTSYDFYKTELYAKIKGTYP